MVMGRAQIKFENITVEKAPPAANQPLRLVLKMAQEVALAGAPTCPRPWKLRLPKKDASDSVKAAVLGMLWQRTYLRECPPYDPGGGAYIGNP